ncbi:hypothetical protein [Streptomyces sp. NBC_01483]|uniref:hypothetical protein n=1 Tax=Streptomyces sp. NBC_01483 TaxID=2903883 RepID=UPI002E377D3B|nr:hypothetical protein [Streptomyces sp. NBC_01483]
MAVQVKKILPRHVAGELALEATQCLSTCEEVQGTFFITRPRRHPLGGLPGQ